MKTSGSSGTVGWCMPMTKDAYQHRPGEKFQNYVLIEPLGKSSFAEVWQARDQHVQGMLVALKIFDANSPAWPLVQAQAQVEADIQTQFVLSSRVVPMQHPQLSHEPPFVAMALMNGGTLQERISKGRGMPIDEVASIFRQILEALQEIHARGLVHRNLKPSNVLFERARTKLPGGNFEHGALRLSDMGFVADRTGSTETPGSIQFGTAIYLAPEQIRPEAGLDAESRQDSTKHVGKTADVYSAGVILYELLTGERPIEGRDAAEVMAKWKDGNLVTIRERMPELSPQLEAVVSRALIRMSKYRFPDADAMLTAFDAAVRASPRAAVPAPAARPAEVRPAGRNVGEESPWEGIPVNPATARPSAATWTPPPQEPAPRQTAATAATAAAAARARQPVEAQPVLDPPDPDPPMFEPWAAQKGPRRNFALAGVLAASTLVVVALGYYFLFGSRATFAGSPDGAPADAPPAAATRLSMCDDVDWSAVPLGNELLKSCKTPGAEARRKRLAELEGIQDWNTRSFDDSDLSQCLNSGVRGCSARLAHVSKLLAVDNWNSAEAKRLVSNGGCAGYGPCLAAQEQQPRVQAQTQAQVPTQKQTPAKQPEPQADTGCIPEVSAPDGEGPPATIQNTPCVPAGKR